MNTVTKQIVNGVELELDMYNTIKNFSSITEFPFEFNEPVIFENNDGLQKLEGELYRFKSDNKDFDCIFFDPNRGEIVLTDFDTEQGLNELNK